MVVPFFGDPCYNIYHKLRRYIENLWKGSEFMIILLILAIVCAILAGLKILEGISLSVIVYAIVAVVCLVIYLVSVIQKKLDS